MSNSKLKEINSESLWPDCDRCWKRHKGRRLAVVKGCFNYVEIHHKKRNCTKGTDKVREDAPKQNLLYAL